MSTGEKPPGVTAITAVNAAFSRIETLARSSAVCHICWGAGRKDKIFSAEDVWPCCQPKPGELDGVAKVNSCMTCMECYKKMAHIFGPACKGWHGEMIESSICS